MQSTAAISLPPPQKNKTKNNNNKNKQTKNNACLYCVSVSYSSVRCAGLFPSFLKNETTKQNKNKTEWWRRQPIQDFCIKDPGNCRFSQCSIDLCKGYKIYWENVKCLNCLYNLNFYNEQKFREYSYEQLLV